MAHVSLRSLAVFAAVVCVGTFLVSGAARVFASANALQGDAPTTVHIAEAPHRLLSVPTFQSGWLQHTSTVMLAGATITVPRSLGIGADSVSVNEKAIRSFLEHTLAPSLNRAPSAMSVFAEDSGYTIKGHVAAGREVDIDATLTAIRVALASRHPEPVVAVVFTSLPGDILGTSAFEVIGSTHMDFEGSSPERLQNIAAAATDLTGIVIPAGSTFSFNDALFPLSAKSYAAAPVIIGGQLIEELGGGVCQLSTGLFRAALTAGLPITERHAHSMKLSLYHPPGLDAAVYPGHKDFRFLNDTSSDILILARAEGAELSISLLGAPTGRSAKLEGPFIQGARMITEKEAEGVLSFQWQQQLTHKDGTTSTIPWNSTYWTAR